MGKDFYENLKVYTEKSSWFNPDNFTSFDESWYLIVSDVKASTMAIDEGRYKDVNIAGALVIIAMLNLSEKHELPFVFGGDGCVVLVPPSLKEAAKKAIEGVLYITEKTLNLTLRVSMSKLEELYNTSCTLSVLKYKVSKSFSQAIFIGNAIEYFEQEIKKDSSKLLKASDTTVDLEGFECRWKDIYSPKDYTLSVLLEIKKDSSLVYEEVFTMIDKIFSKNRSAVTVDNLSVSTSVSKLRKEADLKNTSVYKNLLENILGKFLMFFKITTKDTLWGNYKEDVSAACDSEKFDGSLKLVISATKQELAEFENYLLENKNDLYYGIHKSDRAIMTCLVYERNGAQVHFIDSADGGYAMASKEMKKQKKAINNKYN